MDYIYEVPVILNETFRASLTNFMTFLYQSRDQQLLRKQTHTAVSICLQKHTDPRAHHLTHCPYFYNRPRQASVTGV